MIDRLKAECQDYEQTIVDQHQEIADLKSLLATYNNPAQKTSHKNASQIDELEMENLVRRLQSEIKTLKEQNEQKSVHLANGGDLINNLQQQIKELKHKLSQDEKGRKNNRDVETIQQGRYLESMKTENE